MNVPPTKEIRKVLDRLDNLDLSKYPVEEILDNLQLLSFVPMQVTELNIGCCIYRARKNNGNESFSKKKELSYKPQQFNTTYQRASSPQRTMFYGAWVPSTHADYEVSEENVIALSETSDFLRNPEAFDDGEEIISWGKWRVNREIKLATIQYLDEEQNITPFLKDMCRSTLEWLENDIPESLEQAKLINNYFAEKFSKNDIRDDFDYMISALLTENFIYHGLDGVVYPSIRVDQKGLNVALKPDVVENSLRLEGVAQSRIYKKGNCVVSNNEMVGFLEPGKETFTMRELEIGKDRVSDEYIQKILINKAAT